ncbi:hypothetical protein MPSEU_001104100 [Mayamaea pseudoterrestris]|nr:hypothetical protein MPSEU_001104100 [Mayamaea pseudoterrestris]
MAVVAAAAHRKLQQPSSLFCWRRRQPLGLVLLLAVAAAAFGVFMLLGKQHFPWQPWKHHNSHNATALHHLHTVYLDDHLRQEIPGLTCPYQSFSDLSPSDRLHLELPDNEQMKQSTRTSSFTSSNSNFNNKLTLVCCTTTAGPWNLVVRHSWAPHGASRFLQMVSQNYFLQVPLMRCVSNWICQFGLAGLRSDEWASKIPDDSQWLKVEDHDENGSNSSSNHIHFHTGYFGYTGYGPKTRGRQFFVALSNENQLGKEVYEVPWAELIGSHSFETLSQVYTGYGEDGPDQDKMLLPNAHEYVLREFPNLDYITGCSIVDET